MRPAAEWIHRGNGTEVWLRLRAPEDGPEPEELVLVAPDGTPTETAVGLTRRSGREGTVHDAVIDVGAVLVGGGATVSGTWRVLARSGPTTGPVAADAAAGRAELLVVDGAGARHVTVEGDDDAGLGLQVRQAAPWAEVEYIGFTPGALHLDVRVLGAPADGDLHLVARADEDETELTWPLEARRGGFRAVIDHSPPRAGTWALTVGATGTDAPLPAGRHLDDVARKDTALAYPWHDLDAGQQTLRVRPAFRRDNQLALEVRASQPAPAAEPATPEPAEEPPTDGPPADAGKPDRPRGRRTRDMAPTPGDALARAVRLLAVVAGLAARATRLLRRRRTADAETIHVLLLNAYGMGGTIRTVWNLANALAERSEVQLISVIRPSTRPFFPAGPRVRLDHLDDRRKQAEPRPGGWRGRLEAALARRPSVLVPETDPRAWRFTLLTDVRILRTLWRLPAGILLTTRPGLNLLAARYAPGRLTLVGQEHLLLSAHRPGLRAEIRSDYPRLDALAVLTEEDEADYRRELGPQGPPVHHIPNAVPDVPFPRSDLRSRHVVAAGRFGPAKGFDLLVEAYAQVAEARPDWTLRIYGSGETEEKVRRLIRQYALAEHVHLMGRTDRIWQEMAKASVFALSSRFEGFGMVLIEAFQCGLPVVSFACPRGPRAIVEHEVNGLLVPERDVDALAAALIRMIDDEDLRRRCADGALRSGEPYEMVRVEQRWREVFEGAVAGR